MLYKLYFYGQYKGQLILVEEKPTISECSWFSNMYTESMYEYVTLF